jgi:hypothetical protein
VLCRGGMLALSNHYIALRSGSGPSSRYKKTSSARRMCFFSAHHDMSYNRNKTRFGLLLVDALRNESYDFIKYNQYCLLEVPSRIDL